MKNILLVFLMLLAFGCASSMEKSLDSHMGKMTYDFALKQWGAPDSVVEGENVFVATWNGKSATSIKMNAIDYVLQLTFDKKNKIMRGWKYNEY